MAAEEDVKIQELLKYCKSVPISALRASAKTQISNYLDIEGYVIEEYSNDWYGLAEIIGYSGPEIRKFERTNSPTTTVIDNWVTRKDFSPYVETFIKYLLEIQRPDVIIACEKNIRKDVDFFRQPPRPHPAPRPVEHGLKERYDAFVVYGDTSRDIQFMLEMIKVLEGEEHNFKLYVPGRDDTPGDEKFVVTAEMIAERCRRTIVVLSHGFEQSEYCDFALKLAQSLSPGARTKRVIPILLDKVRVPLILNFVGTVDFSNPMQREWVWPRVAATIKCPIIPDMKDWQATIDDLRNMRYNTEAVSHMWYGLTVACTEFPEEDENESDDKKKDKKKKK